METYLRLFMNFNQDDWPYWLRWAEFAYNTAEQASLKCSPHEFVFARSARRPGDVEADVAGGGGSGEPPEVPAARERFKAVRDMRATLADNLRTAAEYSKKYYNRSYKP
jgi:hypothetical protein